MALPSGLAGSSTMSKRPLDTSSLPMITASRLLTQLMYTKHSVFPALLRLIALIPDILERDFRDHFREGH